MLTVDDVSKCNARYVAHYNYGQDDHGAWQGGYLYQVVEEPRLQFLDRTDRRCREWRLDGELMGDGEAGMRVAVAGLQRPPEIGEREADALRLVPQAWEPLRAVRDRIAAALFAAAAPPVPIQHLDVLQASLNEPQIKAYDIINKLAMKGLIEIGKQYRDLDRSTNPNSWEPTVRLRKAKPT